MASKTALITGITGQDGSYLAERLLSLGYAVHGLVRRSSMFNRGRIDPLRAQANAAQKPVLHYGDLNDVTSLRRVLMQVRPDEIYHLAGQSHVGLSFEIPEVTCQENANATLALLELVRDLGHPVRLYHAASSELFGQPAAAPQNEDTPFAPVNPYGCAKAFAAQMVRVYRDTYGLYLVNGIAFNHESPRRGENFVTRKISRGAAGVALGRQAELVLGSLDAARDWGFAPEYVEAMHLALQAPQPADYVLATGKLSTVREFAAEAFAEVGVPIKFEGEGLQEVGRRTDNGAIVVRQDPKFYRKAEPSRLVGDPARARKVLGWSAKTQGAQVARLMARADLLSGSG